MEVVVELAAVSERSPEVASSSHNPEEAVVEQKKEEASDLGVEHVGDDTSDVMIPTTPFDPPRTFTNFRRRYRVSRKGITKHIGFWTIKKVLHGTITTNRRMPSFV